MIYRSLSSQNLRSLYKGAVQYINIYTQYTHTLSSIPRPHGCLIQEVQIQGLWKEKSHTG